MTKKQQRGRKKGSKAPLLTPRNIEILKAYGEAMECGDGYDAAMEAAAKGGGCTINTVKAVRGSLAPTLSKIRRLLKKEGWTQADIDAEILRLESQEVKIDQHVFRGHYNFQVREGFLDLAGDANELAFLKRELENTTDPARKAWLETTLPRLERLPPGKRFKTIALQYFPAKPYPRKKHSSTKI